MTKHTCRHLFLLPCSGEYDNYLIPLLTCLNQSSVMFLLNVHCQTFMISNYRKHQHIQKKEAILLYQKVWHREEQQPDVPAAKDWCFRFVLFLSYKNATYCLAPENNPWTKTGVYVPDNSLPMQPANTEITITNVFCLCTCLLAYSTDASRWRRLMIFTIKVQLLL